MEKVQILMSTYNGERYLEKQLDSLIDQDYPDIIILIRDDGSSDRTVDIIKKYALKYKQITYYRGENIGVIASFFDLMQKADCDLDYYALSDQDDYWLKNKISQAIKVINSKNQDKPLLYCSRTTLVDNDLEPLKTTIKKHAMRPAFGNALVENICTGCTSVFNKKLIQLVQDKVPDYTVMHDWWLYLLASNSGEIFYDENSYILYRQHNQNVVGARLTYYQEFKTRIKNYRSNRGKISRQAYEFKRLVYANELHRNLLESLIDSKNIKNRIKLMTSNDIYRQRKTDNFIFKLLFLTGKV